MNPEKFDRVFKIRNYRTEEFVYATPAQFRTGQAKRRERRASGRKNRS